MRPLIITFVLLSLFACGETDELVLQDDIKEYQGCWRDTIHSNRDVFIENFIIKDNNVKYVLSHANTHVVIDTLSGTILLGNENKMEWNCYAPITNTNRHVYWDILDLSEYQMILYSNVYGQRVFRKAYHPSIEEYAIQDTLLELFHYQKYLPLYRDDLLEKFGLYNRLSDEKDVAYYVSHPLISKINFHGNYDNDSVYSYSLTIKNGGWHISDSLINSYYTKSREVNGQIEYIDSENLESSNNIIIVDSIAQRIIFSPITDYNYWPDVSHYLGRPIKEIQDEFGKKYAYTYKENPNDESFKYCYQTLRDSIFYFVGFTPDANGIINRCGVELFYHFSANKEKDKAENKCEEIASILGRKYLLSSFDKKNYIYNYFSGPIVTKTGYSIKMRLYRYPHGTGYYRIQIFYNQL